MEIDIDWEKVAAEISAGNYETRNNLSVQLLKVRKMIEDQQTADRLREAAAHVSKLKALKPQTKIFYTGSDGRLLGCEGFKIKDGRDYMLVTFAMGLGKEPMNWKVPYQNLNTEAESKSNTVVKKAINRAFGVSRA